MLLTPVVLATARALRVPAQAACVRHRAPCQQCLAAVSGVQPDQPAGVRRRGAVVCPFHRGHGVAVAGRGRHRIRLAALAFRTRSSGRAARLTPATEDVQVPVFVLVVLALTLAGFAVTSLFGFSPAWAALAGAVVLGVQRLARRPQHVHRRHRGCRWTCRSWRSCCAWAWSWTGHAQRPRRCHARRAAGRRHACPRCSA